MRKKAQAAMEFLLSYGWVMLIFLLVIGTLSYFDVLGSAKFLPQGCLVPGGIRCLDFRVETSRVILVLQNSLGSTITIESVVVTKKDGSSCSYREPTEVENNQKVIFTILGCDNGGVGEQFNGDLDITYTKGSLPRLVKGSIVAKITGETDISSSGTCQNAAEGGLCSGLDMVYGIGYRYMCCKEHEPLCC